MDRLGLVSMDALRVWTVRILAPVAFLAAATVLVILIQHALRSDSSSSGNAATTAIGSTTSGSTGTVVRRYYRIKAGDTLESIAVDFKTTVPRLLQLNPGIDPLSLTPKQRIRVS